MQRDVKGTVKMSMKTDAPPSTTLTRIPFRRQLRWNLIFFAVILAVIPVAIVGYLTIAQVRSNTVNQDQAELQAVATLKQAEISAWLNSSGLVLDSFFANSLVHSQLVSFVASSQQATDQSRINTLLSSFLNIGPEGQRPYQAVFVYDPRGHIIAASDSSEIGKVITRQPYYTSSLQGNYLQSPFYEIGTGALTMFITRPLISDNGQTIGAIAGKLELGTLGAIMTERTGLGDTGETYLVSLENNYLLTPSRYQGYSLTRAYHSQGIDHALNGETGQGIYNNYASPADSVIGVYLWIPQLQAAFLAEVGENEALAPFRATTALTIPIVVIAAVLATIIALYNATRVSSPIAALTRVAAQITSGDLTARAPTREQNEIGVLARTFNTMAEQLQNFVATLENRVAERTRDLQTVVDVNRQIATILNPDRLLQDVADLTKERFSLYHAHIFAMNEAGTTLDLTAGAGYVGRQMVAEGRQIALDNPQSIVANAARNRRGVIVNDVTQSPTFLPHPLLPNTQSEMAVPLIARGQVLGVLDVQSDEVGHFSADVLSVFEIMAGQIATALSNAELFAVADRTSRHERAIGNINREIQSANDLDEVLQAAVRELGKALRVPHTAIELQLTPDNDHQPSGEE